METPGNARRLAFLRLSIGGFLIFAGSALVLSSWGQAKKQAPVAPVQEAPPLQVTTRLVQVNVIVTDGRGNPFRALRRDDFLLLDENQPQEIAVFAMETSESTSAVEEPLPANAFSNHIDRKGTLPGSVTVILLDGLNTRFEDQAYSKGQVIKFLKQLKPTDRVALYTLGRDLRILHDFTSDAAPLLRKLEKYRGRNSLEAEASDPEAPDTGNEEIDAFLAESNQAIADFYTVNRVGRTLAAIEAIANHLQAVPGRKNLVWVSSSFPLRIGADELSLPGPSRDARSFTPEIERTVRALNNSSVAIYPVDARGLVGYFGPRGGAASRRPSPATLGQIRGPIETMLTLADRTGGRAFYNTNDIAGSVRRAIEDSRVTYVLGYYPSHGKWDGKFRRLKVQVKRPGLRARYRQGYFALTQPQLDERQAEGLMRSAAWNPLDATGVGLTVQATPFQSAGANWLRLEVQIAQPGVILEQQEGRWVGGIDFLYIQRREDGTVLAGPVRRLPINMSPESHERAQEQGMTFTRLVETLPGVELMMLIVRDPISGAMGSVRIPVTKISAGSEPPG
jgi:VWFA-related protein